MNEAMHDIVDKYLASGGGDAIPHGVECHLEWSRRKGFTTPPERSGASAVLGNLPLKADFATCSIVRATTAVPTAF